MTIYEKNRENRRKDLPVPHRGYRENVSAFNTVVNKLYDKIARRQIPSTTQKLERFLITEKSNESLVCSGQRMYNSSKDSFEWRIVGTSEFTNIIDDDDKAIVGDEVWAVYTNQDGNWHILFSDVEESEFSESEGSVECFVHLNETRVIEEGGGLIRAQERIVAYYIENGCLKADRGEWEDVVELSDCSICGPEESGDCCDITVFLCICGVRYSLTLNGSVSIDVSECCGCPGAVLNISLSCLDGNVQGSWEYVCGPDVESGEIEQDLSVLCDNENEVSLDGFINSSFCFILFTASNYEEECEEFVGPDPCFCWECPRFGLLVEISGIVNAGGPAVCPNCDQFNGAYFLPFSPDQLTVNCSGIVMDFQNIKQVDCGQFGIISLNLFGNVICQRNAFGQLTGIQLNVGANFGSEAFAPQAMSRNENVSVPLPSCPYQMQGVVSRNPLPGLCDLFATPANIEARWI